MTEEYKIPEKLPTVEASILNPLAPPTGSAQLIETELAKTPPNATELGKLAKALVLIVAAKFGRLFQFKLPTLKK